MTKQKYFDSRDDHLVMKSKEEIDYFGIYKNKYVFIERSGVFNRDKNGEPIINGRLCFYKRGNNAVLKTMRKTLITRKDIFE